MKLLLHTCCAPCSVYCIDKLKENNIDITCYWYNPNIHPFKEYEARLNALKEYTKSISIPLVVNDYYGLKEFCTNVINKIDNRCGYCYLCRLESAFKYASLNGFDAVSTTLLISPYQNHEMIIKTCEMLSKKYNINFFYEDFRIGFRSGQEKARNLGLYMQKYCGCIFSEEERYEKQIKKSIEDSKKYQL